MTHSLDVIPKPSSISTGVKSPEKIAQGLADVLADTYRLVFKTHAYHWNVEGPLFFAVHNLTEAQYGDMFAAADELAERMRSLGKLAPMKMADIISGSVIEDAEDGMSAGEMVEDLASDHEKVAARMHALITLAADKSDPVTEDLATQRSAFHEKAAWMLRAIAAS